MTYSPPRGGSASGALFCHACGQPEIAAGAGTIAEEVLQDEPGIDTIVVAVGGGGGFYAGLATAATGRARIVAVEPFTIPTLHAALKAGRRVDVPDSGIAADSLGARRVGEIAFSIASKEPPISVLVNDDPSSPGGHSHPANTGSPPSTEPQRPSLHSPLAAYLSQEDERIAVIICGANTDPCTLDAPWLRGREKGCHASAWCGGRPVGFPNPSSPSTTEKNAAQMTHAARVLL